MNILMLANVDACYNSLNYFKSKMVKAFVSMGHSVFEPNNYDELLKIKNECDFVFGFNLSLNRKVVDKNLFDEIGLPIVDFIVDHPYLHHMMLSYPLEQDVYVICLDENHKKYIDSYYLNIKETKIGYLLSETVNDIDSIKKDRDVLFPMGYGNEMTYLQMINEKTPWLRNLGLSTIEYILANPTETVEGAIRLQLGASAESISTYKYCYLLHDIGVIIDHFLRCYYRHMLLETITNGGVKVHVCGNGIREFSCSRPENIVFEKTYEYSEMPFILASSKIVINVMPWFKKGIHDRVISTMLNKSVSVTDKTKQIDEVFVDEHDIVTYELNHMSQVVERIEKLLYKQDLIEQISENAYYKAQQLFSWQDIASKIIDFFVK